MFAEPRLGVIESAKVVENDEDVDILLTFPIVDGARRPNSKNIYTFSILEFPNG